MSLLHWSFVIMMLRRLKLSSTALFVDCKIPFILVFFSKHQFTTKVASRCETKRNQQTETIEGIKSCFFLCLSVLNGFKLKESISWLLKEKWCLRLKITKIIPLCTHFPLSSCQQLSDVTVILSDSNIWRGSLVNSN